MHEHRKTMQDTHTSGQKEMGWVRKKGVSTPFYITLLYHLILLYYVTLPCYITLLHYITLYILNIILILKILGYIKIQNNENKKFSLPT